MRAAYIERTGPAREVLQIGELPDPTPGEGEVLVRVRVAGINPSDVKRRGGSRGQRVAGRLVIHNDGAGEVTAVGSGVDPGRVGERVWVHNTDWATPLGTAAELVAVPASDAEPLPDGISFEEGACFGVPLLTACHGVLAGGPISGRCVLVTGADHVVNYRTEDVPAVIAALTDGRGVDHCVEVNLSANGAALPEMMASGGTVAVYGSSDAVTPIDGGVLRRKLVTLHFYNVYLLPDQVLRAAKDAVAPLLREGRIATLIDERFTLDDIVEAHEAVESGRLVGNAVITIT